MEPRSIMVEGLLRGGAPHDELEEDDVRARLRSALFGVRAEPRTLGRFILLERLGAGGFGSVYSAYDPQLDRKIALKVLRPVADTRFDAAAVLRAEAKALGRLAHPNVVVLGKVTFATGDHAKARRHFEDARDIAAARLGPDHPLVGRAERALAKVTSRKARP